MKNFKHTEELKEEYSNYSYYHLDLTEHLRVILDFKMDHAVVFPSYDSPFLL